MSAISDGGMNVYFPYLLIDPEYHGKGLGKITVEKMLENVEADVVLCGHTHIPCGFQTESRKTVVNAGSIGRTFFVEPNSYPKACYLIIEVDNGSCVFQHQFVEYDKEQASEKLAAREFEGADKLAGMLINPEIRHF